MQENSGKDNASIKLVAVHADSKANVDNGFDKGAADEYFFAWEMIYRPATKDKQQDHWQYLHQAYQGQVKGISG